MSNMRKTRELAMQVLFLWDANRDANQDLARQAVHDGSEDPTVRIRALEMADGAWAMREATDVRMERLAPQWPTRRQPGVDRSIIRLAVWELLAADTPPKVVLDEAIELAKAFSTEQSPAFVNGVLDAVLREKMALTQGTEPAPPAADTIAAEPLIAEEKPDQSHGADESERTGDK